MKNITKYLRGTVLANLCVEKAILFVLCILVFGAMVQPVIAQPCNAPDNGSGTANLPADCPYIAPMDVMRIIDGLPAGTTIECVPTFQGFTGITPTPGGTLGGEVENYGASLMLVMTGTGELAGFNKSVIINHTCETHVAPRTPGTPVQSFDTDMFMLQGQLPPGDPDFDLLRITGGSGLGLPSPGHTTLTQVPGAGWNVDSFFDITYRIDFVGAPTGALAGKSGSTTGTIRWQQGNPSTPPQPEFQFSTNHLPPMGVYSSAQDSQTAYPGTDRKTKHWLMSNFRTRTSPPSLGTNVNWNFEGTAKFQHSTDGGSSFFDVFTELSAMVNINHSMDNGDTQVFDTEMLSLSLTGGSLQAGMMLRESPTRASTGKTTIRPAVSGGYMIGSFFDIFTEISLDGGATWSPSSASTKLQLSERTTQSNSFGSLCLTPPAGEYISTPGLFTSYSGGRRLKEFNGKSFTSCDTLPSLGNTAVISTGGSASLKMSNDNGNSFFDVFTELNITVQVTPTRDEGGTRYFDTEMLALNLVSSSPPVMLRESPTLPSRGNLRAIKGTGSDLNIGDFFDIFTEVSVDGGANWSPANIALPLELGVNCLTSITCPPDVVVSTSNPAGQVVNYSPPIAGSLCNPVTVNSNPPSGSTFPVGVTTVVGTATDARGNTASCSFTVTVNLTSSGCLAQDTGNCTAKLPAPCQYTGAPELMYIIDGLPPGTTIESDASFNTFINIIRTAGGSPGAEVQEFNGQLSLAMNGTGSLNTFSRSINITNVAAITHTGVRNNCNSRQQFSADMYQFSGQIIGDPDFDLLRITAGTGFGLPSPGQVTLTRQPSGEWAVESFFDITYRIDFVGAPGGQLTGRSGSTTGTIRMKQGSKSDPAEILLPQNCFPPNGYVKELPTGKRQHGSIHIQKEWRMKDFSMCQPLPPPGGSQVHTYTGNASFKFSNNSGDSFFDVFTEVSCVTQIAYGSVEGGRTVYNTEMLAMNLSNPSVMMRESPTRQSTGKTTVREVAPDYYISSFFDIFTEISVDGGATWIPAPESLRIELDNLVKTPGDTCGTLSIFCPPDTSVTTTNPAGKVVYYGTPGTVGGCPPITVTCNPPSGSTFPVGVTTVTCTATDAQGNTASCSFSVTVRLESNPPFTENPPPFRDRHLCSPLFMNTNNTGSENLYVRAAGGDMFVEFIAHAVNFTDPETAHVQIWDGATLVYEMGVGYTSAEAASMPEFEKAVSVTFPGVTAGTLYRFEVTTPSPTPPTQPHWRVELDGVLGAAINSPTWPSFEEVYARWYVYVGAENQLDLDFFTTGVPTPATNAFIHIVTPGGTLHPASGPTAITGATEVSISPAASGMWMIEVPFIDGHYRLNKLSGADQAIYVGGATGGRGHKRIVIHRNDKLDTSVAYSVKARMRVAGQEGDVWQDMDSTASQNGMADFDKLPQGYFSFEVTPRQPGVSVPPIQFDSLFCDSIVVDTFKTRDLVGVIEGYKWHDKNGDGVWDATEPGLPNWKIYLDFDDGNPVTYAMDSMLTDANGYYSFNNVSPGYKQIFEETVSGWYQTSTPAVYSFTVVGGDTMRNVNFGNRRTTGRICIVKYFDINHNQQPDPDEPPMGDVGFTLASVAGNTYQDETDANGQLCFEVEAGFYTLTELVPPGYTVIWPKAGFMEFQVAPESDTAVVWLNAPSRTDSSYRSHTYEEWAHELSKDEKGKLKALKCKPDAVKFKFNLIVQTDTLKMKFNMKTNGQTYLGKGKTVPFDTAWIEKKEVTHIFHGNVQPGDTIQIDGFGFDGKAIKVDYQWLTLSGGRSKIVKKGTLPGRKAVVGDTIKYHQLLLPMPNLVNVGEELYKQQAFPFTTGAPRDSHSVVYLKYQDVQKSLVKESRGRYIMDTARARCLDKFEGTNGKPILKQQKSLPPDKHNNVLYAQTLTLQLNVMASEHEKFPTGFGQLIYDNALNPSELDGLTIDSILSLANYVLSCNGDVPVDVTPGEFADALEEINGAFSGPIDTLVWNCSKIMLKGTKPLKQVTFLRAPLELPSISARVRTPAIVTYQQPETFTLHQNYPNPFNPTTTIRFDLPEDAVVTLKIYNSLGQEVASVLDRAEMYEGEQEVDFDATSLPSGIYIYRIVAERLSDDDETVSGPNFFSVKKMVLMK